MSQDAVSRYQARMQRVLAFIDAHLDEDLDAARLSAVASLSPHHFQRQFSSAYGVSLGRYVQLLRLKRAATRLAFRQDDPVLEVALDSGYAGPEAFARVFRDRFGQSPTGFRDQPDWDAWRTSQAPLTLARSRGMPRAFTDVDVRIVDFPATRVAVLEHRGDPRRIGDSVRRFIAWRGAAGLPPRISPTFNIFHDDPEETAADDYRLGLCAATNRAVPPNAQGVVAGEIPGGPCAVLRQVGGSDDLRAAATYLYGEWLAGSGRELRDFPLFAQRVTVFPDVGEHEAITDLFLPLA